MSIDREEMLVLAIKLELRISSEHDYRPWSNIETAIRYALSTDPPKAEPVATRARIEYDDFEGTIIGHYTTREGRKGFVIQQDGTRVVHVYGENRAALSPSPSMGTPKDPI